MIRHLSALLGHHADRPLTLLGPLDLTSASSEALRQPVLYVVAEADAGRRAIGSGLMGCQVKSALMSGFLQAHCQDYQAPLGQLRAAPRQRHVRLA